MAKTKTSPARKGKAMSRPYAGKSGVKAATKPQVKAVTAGGTAAAAAAAKAVLREIVAPPAPAPALTIVARLHGIEVPAAPHLDAALRQAIDEGRYEAREIRAALACIPKGARILELGASTGIVGAVLARQLAPAAMLSVEADPRAMEAIRALHAHNGLSEVISLRNAVVLSAPDAPESVELFLRENGVGVSILPPDGGEAKPLAVPVLRYADLAAEFPHDAIMMDIEGAELDFLRHADLSAVKIVVGEFHRDVYGRPGMRECRELLAAQGFAMDEEQSRNGVWAWVRV